MLEGRLVTRSSIMPQKRNPSAIERLRLATSETIGQAQTSMLMAHNTPLYESKDVREDHFVRLAGYVDDAEEMYRQLRAVLESLVVRPESFRRKVDAEYSTMTELADTLHREAGVPFRVGHEVASELTRYGRSQRKTPGELTREEVERVYRKVTGRDLPLSEEQVRKAFDAGEFVRGRKGRGGPQPESVRAMLGTQRAQVESTRSWVASKRRALQAASTELAGRVNAMGG